MGMTAAATGIEKPPGAAYRFQTPECDVRMTVEFFASVLGNSFSFRDNVADRNFCLSAGGNENQNCLSDFSGSMAIATYWFRSRRHSNKPSVLRESVVTIDHDSRMAPRPVFEKTLAIEQGMVSDIQAFGYDPQDPAVRVQPLSLWCLLRQNLYLNNRKDPFLIVHWKHTFDSITVVDVIPGDNTRLLTD